jgi:hypothetical protein
VRDEEEVKQKIEELRSDRHYRDSRFAQARQSSRDSRSNVNLRTFLAVGRLPWL